MEDQLTADEGDRSNGSSVHHREINVESIGDDANGDQEPSHSRDSFELDSKSGGQSQQHDATRITVPDAGSVRLLTLSLI